MSATLNIQDMPEVAGMRAYVIDCPHGTTTVTCINPAAAGLTDRDSVLLALARHDEEEGCGCTAGLWRRYAKVSP
jgi:hypothetical protein